MQFGVLVLGVLVGCGDNLHPVADALVADAPADAMPDAVPDAIPDAPATCSTTLVDPPLAAGAHVTACSPVAYASNPPTSGAHYPNWARYKVYDTTFPRPFWVHDLEHGAVVVTYNCPGGCADDVAALTAFLAARPVDPTCVAPVTNRFIVVPDPALDVKFAASAWGHALRSSCFDLAGLATFIDTYYAHAPENLCGDGIDPPACP